MVHSGKGLAIIVFESRKKQICVWRWKRKWDNAAARVIRERDREGSC